MPELRDNNGYHLTLNRRNPDLVAIIPYFGYNPIYVDQDEIGALTHGIETEFSGRQY